ncbi:MAG: DNA-processing protein DprA, partial [Pseudomonadota bacterium]
IDTEAHTSCLHSQGLTVAVLGTGVDVVYPKQNQGLYNQIVSAGLVVSEYPDGTLPDRAHFPQRNRIIAGLSRAILVTEAPARSGALITSRLANEYCREVYALPCSLDNVQGEGCLRAIEQGAQMILGEQVLAEALAMLPPMAMPFPGQVVAAEGLLVEDLGASNGTLMTEGAGRSPVDAIVTTASTRSAVSSAAPSAVSSAVPSAVPSAATASPVAVAQPDLSAVVEGLSPALRQVFDAVPIEPAVLDYIVPLVPMTPGEVMGALVQLELLGLVSQLPGMHYQRV